MRADNCIMYTKEDVYGTRWLIYLIKQHLSFITILIFPSEIVCTPISSNHATQYGCCHKIPGFLLIQNARRLVVSVSPPSKNALSWCHKNLGIQIAPITSKKTQRSRFLKSWENSGGIHISMLSMKENQCTPSYVAVRAIIMSLLSSRLRLKLLYSNTFGEKKNLYFLWKKSFFWANDFSKRCVCVYFQCPPRVTPPLK